MKDLGQYLTEHICGDEKNSLTGVIDPDALPDVIRQGIKAYENEYNVKVNVE